MSDKDNNRADAEPAKAKEKAQAPAAPKYLIGKLREACVELFGITTSTFDGAFCGCAAKEMTIDEARARINKWLGRKEK